MPGPKKVKGDGSGPGRPTKKTDSRIKILKECLLSSMPVEIACSYAKITKQTYDNWCKSDPDFLVEMEFYKAQGVQPLLEKIADQDPWKLAKNIFPSVLRDKITQEHEGTGGDPIQMVVTDYRSESDGED